MLRRVAWSIVALCIALCILGPITWFTIDSFFQPWTYIQRNPDGSSTGYYLENNATLLVRNRGFGAGLDVDTRYNPWVYIPLFAIAPAFWFCTHRNRKSLNRAQLRFLRCCAFCPLSAAILVGWFRRDDDDGKYHGLPLLTILLALLILIIAALVRALKMIPSLHQRRTAKGLCAHCGYDLRATSDPAGPRLDRCPECGQLSPRAKTGTLMTIEHDKIIP